ncbi:MAG: hypothetical protein ACXAC2_10800 [Candidatus Kariarchaeaceae archaeon]
MVFSYLLLMAMITSSFVSVPISGDSNYSTPTKREVSGVFPSQTGNDVYVQGNREASIINPTIWSDTDFNVYSTVDSQRYYEDSISPTEHPSVANYDGFTEHGSMGSSAIFQANNQSNTPMDIFYFGEYNDLAHDNSSGKSSFNEIKNIVMRSGEYYGFRFVVNDLLPLALVLNFETYVEIKFYLLDPSGNIIVRPESWYEYFSMKKDEIIPLVPNYLGNHTLFMYPVQNTVLSSLKLYDDNPIQTVEGVATGTIKSDDTMVKFFKFETQSNGALNLNGLSNSKVIQFDAKTTIEYGSGGIVQVFSQHSTNIFGSGSSSVFVGNTTVYVSVTAEVPYDDEKDRKVNQHFDYPTGVKLDYFIWISQYDIPQLPIGVDFTTEPMAYDGGHNYYYYDTASSALSLDQNSNGIALGLNSTGTSSADFNDITTQTVRTINSNSHDLINDPTDNIVQLSGAFIVELDRYETMRFTEIPIQSGSSWTIGSTLDSVHIFYVPATQFSLDMFNVSLISRHNATARFQFDYFDNSGIRVHQTKDWFSYVTNSANPSYLIEETRLYDPASYNVQGMYLRVSQVENKKYNGTTSTPSVLLTDDKDLSTSLRIDRINGVNYLQNLNPNSVYEQSSMNAIFSRFLNATNNSINYWVDLSLDPGAYLYTFKIVNRSIDVLYLYTDLSGWTNILINGYPTFEFAVTRKTRFGFYIDLDSSSGFNGSLEIMREVITPYVFPSLVLGFVTPNRSPEAKKSDKGPLDFPWFTVVVALSALVIPLRSRKREINK